MQKTLDRLQQAPTQPGQKSPLLVYFGILLQKGQLNAAESTNIAKLVLSQGKPQLLTGWIFELLPQSPEDFDRAKWLVVETVCGGLQNVERG